MDEMLKRYRHLDRELFCARRAIRRIKTNIQICPQSRTTHNQLKHDLQTAIEVRDDILNDIHKITDTEPTLNLNLLFAIS